MSSTNSKSPPAIMTCTTESTGRIRHDERGAAVWDWTIETGVFDALSSSGLLRCLTVDNLKVLESPGLPHAITGRDAGGGGDPYNFRGVVPMRTRHR